MTTGLVAANPWPAAVYALLVAAFLLLPYVFRKTAAPGGDPRQDPWLAAALVAGGCLIAVLRGGELIEGPVLILLTALGRDRLPIAGAAAAGLLFAPVTWWLPRYGIAIEQRLLFDAFCLVLAGLARQASFVASAPDAAPRVSREALTVAGLLALGLVAGMLTGAANERRSVLTAWHHWGAYLSPVTALLAGGVPFRDFPVQYGMGPTLLIAGTCRWGCWTGIYWLAVVGNALNLAAMGWSLLLLTRRFDAPARALALAALVCAMLIWPGFPADWGSPIMTPSVGGMRFLPLVLMLALVLTAEQTAPAPAQGRDMLPCWIKGAGLALWFVGLLWSPENAFFASLLWWPWLALRRADAATSAREAWLCLVNGGLLGMAASLAGYAVLAILFRLAFGAWVTLDEFLLYLRNPPGPLPVNPLGPIWFVAAILLLAARALARQPHSPPWRALYAVTMTALAALSYYLSRSHDNQIPNLLAFLVLALIAAQALQPTRFVTGFVRAALVAAVAFTASIEWHAWTVMPGGWTFAGLQVGPEALTARFAPSLRLRAPLADPDAAAAFDDLHRLGARSILLFDRHRVMPLGDSASDWTGVNNLANILPLPGDVVRHYIERGAAVYHRPGWLVLSRSDYGKSLGLFQTAYDVTEERRYGAYSAYRLVPRGAH